MGGAASRALNPGLGCSDGWILGWNWQLATVLGEIGNSERNPCSGLQHHDSPLKLKPPPLSPPG